MTAPDDGRSGVEATGTAAAAGTHPRADLCYLSIGELGHLLRTRELSVIDLTEAFLRQIHRLDESVHAFITVTPDLAREDARRADAEIADDRWRGPLHGIPIALKDIIDTAGVRTTAGSRLLSDRVPRRDAEIVQHLRAAGCVFLGKLRLHEFAVGNGDADGFGQAARNPWDLARDPGGSSTGAAAALAAGLCAGAIGTDTGGSVRMPAAYSGIVGLRPTTGLLSLRGVLPLSWSFDTVGPMARSVRDLALLYRAILTTNASSRQFHPVPAISAAAPPSITGLAIGVPWRYIDAASDLDPCVRDAFASAIDLLRGLGGLIREIDLPRAERILPVFETIFLAEAATYHEKSLRARPDQYAEGTRENLRRGFSYLATEYVRAQRMRTAIRDQFDRLFRSVDVMATPTMAAPPPVLGEVHEHGTDGHPLGHLRFTAPSSVIGCPSLSLPAGFDARGLPVGLLLSGPAHGEDQIIRLGIGYQATTDWHTRRPTAVASY